MTLSVEDFLLSIQKLILGNDLNTTYKWHWCWPSRTRQEKFLL